jgi:predicted amidohydrolase YtcJ
MILWLSHACSHCRAQSAAELVVVNAQVVTCDEGFQISEAVAIQNGRFIAVGSNVDVRKRIGPATAVMDANGQTLTPGLIDSHVHFVGLGESLQMLNLMHAASWESIVQQVAAAAMQLAGIDQDTPDPPGGQILRDARGEAIGVFIEHAQHLAVEDIPRFGKLGVIPAMQANHCTSDAPFVPVRLGERRSAEGAYTWRALIDSGAIIANGTDAPVESIDPRVSLYASVTRQLPDGSQFFPEQCMTREEALLSYTRWAAQAGFQEHYIGSIEVGKRADFVLWDTDLLHCPAEALLTAQAMRVWVAGAERPAVVDRSSIESQ